MKKTSYHTYYVSDTAHHLTNISIICMINVHLTYGMSCFTCIPLLSRVIFKDINQIPPSPPLALSSARSLCQGHTGLLCAQAYSRLLSTPVHCPCFSFGLELSGLRPLPVGLYFVMQVTAHLSHPQRALLLSDTASSSTPESGVSCHKSPFYFHHSTFVNLMLCCSCVRM